MTVFNHPEVTVQLSSRWYLGTWKSPGVLHPVSEKFPQHCFWNSLTVLLIDGGSFLPFAGRLLSASFFHASLLQAINGVLSMPFGPQVVSSSSTLQIFWDTNHLWWLLCPQVYLLSNFPSLWHVHGGIPLGAFLYTDSTEKGSSYWRGKEWNAYAVGVLL